MSDNNSFSLSHQNHSNFKQVAEDLKKIEDFMNTIVQFRTTAPNDSDKGALIIVFDGTNIDLYVQGKRGATLARSFKRIDNS